MKKHGRKRPGAGNGTRTRNPLRGRQLIYHLIYTGIQNGPIRTRPGRYSFHYFPHHLTAQSETGGKPADPKRMCDFVGRPHGGECGRSHRKQRRKHQADCEPKDVTARAEPIQNCFDSTHSSLPPFFSNFGRLEWCCRPLFLTPKAPLVMSL